MTWWVVIIGGLLVGLGIVVGYGAACLLGNFDE